MKTYFPTVLVLIASLAWCADEAAAQGRGRGVGAQRGMRGRAGAGAAGARGNAMRPRRMQYGLRQGQQGAAARGGAAQRLQLRDGSCGGQPGRGAPGGQGPCPFRGGSAARWNAGDCGLGSGFQASADLSQAEIDSLLVMREEEKLARDVYRTLADRWSSPVFTNIAGSETRHMTVIGQIIQAYGLDDPVVDDAVGAFASPKFSKLYEELVQVGSQSLRDAYEVGVKIEEMDIEDLEKSLSQASDSQVRRVYQNLLRASQNHLRAFTLQLDAAS